MSYFVSYLVVGMILILIHKIWYWHSDQHKTASSQSYTTDHRPKWNLWRIWILNKGIVVAVLKGILLNALFWAIALLLWPVLLVMFIHEKCFPTPAVDLTEKEFEVVRENLIQQRTIPEIEARERVTDPLGAVPDLPFGHLNTTWTRFKSELQAGDSIWSFSAQWTSDWGNSDIREGYAILRDHDIGTHFLTEIQAIEKMQEQKACKRGIADWLRKRSD